MTIVPKRWGAKNRRFLAGWLEGDPTTQSVLKSIRMNNI